MYFFSHHLAFMRSCKLTKYIYDLSVILSLTTIVDENDKHLLEKAESIVALSKNSIFPRPIHVFFYKKLKNPKLGRKIKKHRRLFSNIKGTFCIGKKKCTKFLRIWREIRQKSPEFRNC